MSAPEIPLDRVLLNKLAEDVMFGPQSNHAKIRHQALMAVTKAYEAGFNAARKPHEIA